MAIASETLKRVFGQFQDISKRGAVEIDLTKVATTISKSSGVLGTGGDIDALAKEVGEISAFLEKVEHDPSTDRFLAPACDMAMRFGVDKKTKKDVGSPSTGQTPGSPGMLLDVNDVQEPMVTEGLGMRKASVTVETGEAPPGSEKYQYTGSGKKPKLDQKAQGYTSGSGVANAASSKDQYSNSGGKQDTSFNTPARSDQSKGKAKKVAVDDDQDGDESDEVVTPKDDADDKSDAAAKKKSATGKKGKPFPGAAKPFGADDEDPAKDDSDEKPAKKKTAKAGASAKGKAQFDGPEESVDELDSDEREEAPEKLMKPTTTELFDASVDEVDKAKTGKAKKAAAPDPDESEDETDDDEEEAPAKKTKKAEKKGNPFDDIDEADEDEDEEDDAPKGKKKRLAKSFDDGKTSWEDDLAPANAPYTRAERLTTAEVPLGAREGTLSVARSVQKIRKSAMSDEGLTAEQRRRARVKELTQGGFSPRVTS